MQTERNPWWGLSALVVGFFMILLDLTIVAVANPAIMADLQADINQVVWVTSAYLLTYAVPPLFTGRLGDRFGPKHIYLAGLVVFTAASLWCATSGTIEMLIAARAVQGLGAALMTPQTMATITRTFAPDKRGAAMGLWGAVAGLASLLGPLVGGVLVDWQGWNWIFYINVPVGIIAFVLAAWLVPSLETQPHKFDVVGVILSGVGLFLLVFGIQEGSSRDWDVWTWTMIVAGIAVMVLFVFNQARNKGEPLVPLALFRDRNFSMSNIAISSMGAAMTALMVPAYFYLETVRGFSPTKAALIFAPMAIVTGPTAPLIGRFSDRMPPRVLAHRRLHALLRDDLRVRGAYDAGQPHRAVPAHRRYRRPVQFVHLGAAGLHRNAQPADPPGGRRCRHLQHHPPGRFGAGQRRDRCSDLVADGRPRIG